MPGGGSPPIKVDTLANPSLATPCTPFADVLSLAPWPCVLSMALSWRPGTLSIDAAFTDAHPLPSASIDRHTWFGEVMVMTPSPQPHTMYVCIFSRQISVRP